MSNEPSAPATTVRENALQPKSGWVILPFHFMMLGINIALTFRGAHGDGYNPAPILIIAGILGMVVWFILWAGYFAVQPGDSPRPSAARKAMATTPNRS